MPRVGAVDKPAERAALWRGAGCCVLFAVVAVTVRGVRWDETFEHAQLLAGRVVYPEGHPLALYVHNAFSLQTHLSAWMLSIGLGPVVLCGFRNVLFLLASILPAYVLTAWISRSTSAGLFAALLVLQGILLEFDGSYPTMTWPELYSNGHIGGGVVLMALFALLSGARRTAFFMIGLIPCIHVGQWPPLFATAMLFALYLAWEQRKEGQEARGTSLATSAAYLALGFGATFAFWLLHRMSALPMPESGPFAVGGDVESVWRGYTSLYDPHRRFPPGNGHVVLVGVTLLFGLGAVWGATERVRRVCLWLGVYCGVIAVIVWGIMAVHARVGADIPFLLIAWMPYRLINHVPVIGLVVMAALILARWPVRGLGVLCAAALVGLLQPWWPYLLGDALYQRYVAGGECVAFGLYGVALAAVAPTRGGQRWAVAGMAAVAIMPLAMYHRFGAACVVGGIFVGVGLRGMTVRSANLERWARVAVLVALSAGSWGLLWHQFHYRTSLPVSPFQAEIARELRGQAGVMLLAPPDSLLLQATTGLPVLAEVATPSLISYVPAIGPAIDQFYIDVYGAGFQLQDLNAPTPIPWDTLWQSRSGAAWRSLSERYGFSHVVAPIGLALDLPQILAATDYALYAVNR